VGDHNAAARTPKGEAMPAQQLVDLIPRSRRRNGRSPRKVLRILREQNAATLAEALGVSRNARRQARADRTSA
jgi:hypothetical protein